MPRLVLTEAEMGAIALKYFRHRVLKESVSMNADKIRREIGNAAKEMEIPPDTVLQFIAQILSPAFEKVLTDLSK